MRRPDEFPDLLHPNDAGYAKWAAALRPLFATLGLIDTTAEPFTPEDGFESLFNGRDLTGWGYRPTTEADKESAKRWQASDPERRGMAVRHGGRRVRRPAPRPRTDASP